MKRKCIDCPHWNSSTRKCAVDNATHSPSSGCNR